MIKIYVRECNRSSFLHVSPVLDLIDVQDEKPVARSESTLAHFCRPNRNQFDSELQWGVDPSAIASKEHGQSIFLGRSLSPNVNLALSQNRGPAK